MGPPTSTLALPLLAPASCPAAALSASSADTLPGPGALELDTPSAPPTCATVAGDISKEVYAVLSQSDDLAVSPPTRIAATGDISKDVYAVVSMATDDFRGMHIRDIHAALSASYFVDDVRQVFLQWLAVGSAYSTIDDEHFAIIVAPV